MSKQSYREKELRLGKKMIDIMTEAIRKVFLEQRVASVEPRLRRR